MGENVRKRKFTLEVGLSRKMLVRMSVEAAVSYHKNTAQFLLVRDDGCAR